MKKQFISGFICCLLLTFSINVLANYIYKAKDIEFNSSYTNMNNVEDAINELYYKREVYFKEITTSFSKINDYNIVLNDDLTWTNKNVSYNGACYYMSIDLTNINYLLIRGKRIEYPGEQYHKQKIAIVDSVPTLDMGYTSLVQKEMPEGEFDVLLDVSSITGEHYLMLDVTASSGYITSIMKL